MITVLVVLHRRVVPTPFCVIKLPKLKYKERRMKNNNNNNKKQNKHARIWGQFQMV